MTPYFISQFSSGLLALAGESAIRSIVVALAAGLVLVVIRVKQPGLRLTSWTGVLYAAMMMPLLGFVLPSINLRLLPGGPLGSRAVGLSAPARPSDGGMIEPSPAVGTQPLSAFAARTARGPGPLIEDAATVTESQTAAGSSTVTNPRLWWWGLMATVYLLVASILFVRVITGIVLSRRMRKRAGQITDPEIGWLVNQLSGPPFRSVRVTVAESSSVSVPVAVGAFDPMILLPRGWREWEHQKLRAVLAHELSHVARRDALTQLVSAIHRSIFWFSPLPWWLHRRLIDLAEQASDESALLAVQDPAFYAEVLLGFFQSMNRVPARWLGVSMARGERAGRRIERMLSAAVPSPLGPKRKSVAVVVMLVVLLAATTASLRVGQASSADQNKKRASSRRSIDPALVPSTSTSVPAIAGESRTGSSAGVPSAALPPVQGLESGAAGVVEPALAIDGEIGQQAAPALPPAAAAPTLPALPAAIAPGGPLGAVPRAAAPVSPAIAGLTPFAAIAPNAPMMALPPPALQDKDGWPDNRSESFAIVTRDGSRMTGTWSFDEENMRSLRKKMKGDFIWFKHNGGGYVITDPATIKAALEFFAPQEELGHRQAELGKRQAALGEKQADLSRQMAAVRIEMPDLTADLRKISDRMKGARTQEELSELQGELSQLQARLSAAQSHAGQEQSRFGEMQSELGRQQSALGEEQSRLGQEQSRLAREASRKVRRLLDRALSDGLAQPEP